MDGGTCPLWFSVPPTHLFSLRANLHEITALQTNCELLWTQIVLANSNKLYIGAYYRLHVGDQNSIDELNLSSTNRTHVTVLLTPLSLM